MALEGNFRHSISAGMFAFAAVSTLSFVICTEKARLQSDEMKRYFEKHDIKQLPPEK
jgi:hypothetical protein